MPQVHNYGTPLPPLLIITSDSPQFDPDLLTKWADEGYRINYVYNAQSRHFQDIAENLESDEGYGIIAYGAPAVHALFFARSPSRKLSAVIAYYPPALPPQNIHPTLKNKVLIHLAESQPFGAIANTKVYKDTDVGFAEPHRNMEKPRVYKRIEAEIAFSRSIELLNRAGLVGILDSENVPKLTIPATTTALAEGKIDVEAIWECYFHSLFTAKDSDSIMQITVGYRTKGQEKPYILFVPTTVGVNNRDAIEKFYREIFFPSLPPTLNTRLITRTFNQTTLVDEILFSFRHTCEMAWLLPGLEATDKVVEVIMMWVVGFKSGRIGEVRVYWDQSSAIAQLGIIQNNTPVSGEVAARKVLNPWADSMG